MVIPSSLNQFQQETNQNGSLTQHTTTYCHMHGLFPTPQYTWTHNLLHESLGVGLTRIDDNLVIGFLDS